ncbi:MAG: nitroreductase family protein [Bacteroidales bacterium]
MLEEMKNRRTIRQYQEKMISEEKLTNLLKIACRASTMGNMQLYSIVVTRDAEMKEKLAPAHFNQPMVRTAPVVLTFCADFNRAVKWCEQREADHGYDNFQSFIAAATDALLVAQSFCNAAEAAGFGICYLGTTTYNAQPIIDTLRLPELVVPVTTVTVGYPAESPEQVERLPLTGVVHYESYEPNTRARIDCVYTEKENLAANIRFVEENNKKTLAQVFTDVRYTRKNNEFFSDAFLKVLENQGFLKGKLNF